MTVGSTGVRRRIPELMLVEHELSVPLHYSGAGDETITVFARELVGDQPGAADFPLLVFFQGGPGFEAPRTLAAPDPRSWLGRALREYRVLMLDERGTGRSTPVGHLTGLDPEAQAAYLTNFRADSIVRDAELFREALGADRWSVMGQSFGGFCVLAYLSAFPQSLREAFICGGLPPVDRPIDDVYERTYARVLDRCRNYYARYPDDRQRVREIHQRIGEGMVVLPTGERLTSRRFRQLGLLLGMSTGAERLHYIVEQPTDSLGFAHDVAHANEFGRNPLFAVVHESCYADGWVTNWCAERLLPRVLADDPDHFTGEHIYSWMFDDYAELQPFRETAEILARHEWPHLYDAEVLAANEVPTAAVIYANDMYVPRELSEETAALVRNLRPWLTNEYEHNGIGVDGARILDRLISLVRA